MAIATVTTFLILDCNGEALLPAGPTVFDDKIEEYTPGVNITPLSPGPEVDLDIEGLPLDQVNPISTKTTINADQGGKFSISFSRFSEAKSVFEGQARCNGKPNAIGLTRPIPENPKVILKILSSDKDSAFNCKTTEGIIIDVDNVGFFETEGTTLRIVLRADKEARIAVFSGRILFTPQDEYRIQPILIAERTEVLVDVTDRTIQPPTPATFSTEEGREFEVLDKSIITTDETEKPATVAPPTSTPVQDPAPTSTSEPNPSPTSTPEPNPTPTSTPEPNPTPTSTPEPDPESGHRHIVSEENGGIVADLAKTWFVSDDGLEWEFELRSDVLTPDDARLTCSVIVAILEAEREEVAGYERSVCVDDFTLHIRTRSPDDSFLLTVSGIDIPTLEGE